jgi:hypothetical protein
MSDWITADEYEAVVEQARQMLVEARADREWYDPERRVVRSNEGYWYAQTEPEKDYSGEGG